MDLLRKAWAIPIAQNALSAMQRGGRGRGRAGAAGGRGGARAANRKRCRLGVLGCNGIDDDIELRGQTICVLHAFDRGIFETQTEVEMIQEAKDRGFKLLGEDGKPMQGLAANARLVKTTEVRCLCAWVCDVVCFLADAVCLLACVIRFWRSSFRRQCRLIWRQSGSMALLSSMGRRVRS